jgi:prevent-host-death family protein
MALILQPVLALDKAPTAVDLATMEDTTEDTISIDDLRAQLDEVLAKAHDGASVIITRDGEPYAAIISVSDSNALIEIDEILDRVGVGIELEKGKADDLLARLRLSQPVKRIDDETKD